MEWVPGRHHKVFARTEDVREFITKKIQEHEDTLDPSSPRDYIDCFLMRLSQVQYDKVYYKFVSFTLIMFRMLTYYESM